MSDESPPASERFLDLYALLGLGPLEPDRARIQQSLKRLASQIQAHSQSTAKDAPSPAQIGRARKLFELGKQHLLDPAAKARYDQQWQAVYGSGQTWDLSELRTLLPEGDPSAPFRPAEYLASLEPELAAHYAEDFDKLLSLLAVQPASDHRDAATASAAATDNAMSSPGTQSAAQSALLPQPPVPPLAQRLRKKQGPPLLWQAIGVLAAVGIVLGIAYWRLQPATDQPDKDPALAAKPAQQSSLGLLPAADDLLSTTRSPAASGSVNRLATANESAPRRSGLPSVPGIDAIVPTGEAATQGTSMSPDASSVPEESAMPDSSTQNNAMSDMPTPESAASSQGDPLSDDERQQWTEGMLAARDAIGQQQFTQATAQLDSLQPLARTQLQTEQLTRLVTIEQLAQRFRQALDRALAGMGAAESFSFGDSNLASFVEAEGERIVLRIEGRNQAFAMQAIPIELAFAIVDMAMDREHPQSLAAKAAFLLVHPAAQGDQRAVEQAQQMMSAAVAARVVPQDMQQAFQDDFELP